MHLCVFISRCVCAHVCVWMVTQVAQSKQWMHLCKWHRESCCVWEAIGEWGMLCKLCHLERKRKEKRKNKCSTTRHSRRWAGRRGQVWVQEIGLAFLHLLNSKNSGCKCRVYFEGSGTVMRAVPLRVFWPRSKRQTQCGRANPPAGGYLPGFTVRTVRLSASSGETVLSSIKTTNRQPTCTTGAGESFCQRELFGGEIQLQRRRHPQVGTGDSGCGTS